MEKLISPNPYEVLEISPNADRGTIKRALAEKQRKSTDQAQRQQALKARNALLSVEKRLVVDALTPDFLMANVSDSIAVDLEQIEPPEWREIVDPDEILEKDLEAVIRASIRQTMPPIPVPASPVLLRTDWDGLENYADQRVFSDPIHPQEEQSDLVVDAPASQATLVRPREQRQDAHDSAHTIRRSERHTGGYSVLLGLIAVVLIPAILGVLVGAVLWLDTPWNAGVAVHPPQPTLVATLGDSAIGTDEASAITDTTTATVSAISISTETMTLTSDHEVVSTATPAVPQTHSVAVTGVLSPSSTVVARSTSTDLPTATEPFRTTATRTATRTATVTATATETQTSTATATPTFTTTPTRTPTKPKTATPSQTPTASLVEFVIISISRVNVRLCPRLDCDVVTLLEPGARVLVKGTADGDSIGEDDRWYVFVYEDRDVYVHSSLAVEYRP